MPGTQPLRTLPLEGKLSAKQTDEVFPPFLANTVYK